MHGSHTTRDPVRLVHVHMCMPLPIGADDGVDPRNAYLSINFKLDLKLKSGLKILRSVQGTFEAPQQGFQPHGTITGGSSGWCSSVGMTSRISWSTWSVCHWKSIFRMDKYPLETSGGWW